MFPNSNLIFNKNYYAINTGGLRLKNSAIMTKIINESITYEKNDLFIEDNTVSLFKILGIKSILTSFELKNKNFKLIKAINNKKYNINLYEVKNFSDSFFYVPAKLNKIYYPLEFTDYYAENKLSAENSIIENTDKEEISNNKNYIITKSIHKEKLYEVEGKLEKETYFVFKQNYYPEWSLYIDDKKATPFKINLVHTGVLVPKGKHRIVLKYENYSFRNGSIISFVYMFILLLIIRRINIKLI